MEKKFGKMVKSGKAHQKGTHQEAKRGEYYESTLLAELKEILNQSSEEIDTQNDDSSRI